MIKGNKGLQDLANLMEIAGQVSNLGTIVFTYPTKTNCVQFKALLNDLENCVITVIEDIPTPNSLSQPLKQRQNTNDLLSERLFVAAQQNSLSDEMTFFQKGYLWQILQNRLQEIEQELKEKAAMIRNQIEPPISELSNEGNEKEEAQENFGTINIYL